jgi:hypothetical protein
VGFGKLAGTSTSFKGIMRVEISDQAIASELERLRSLFIQLKPKSKTLADDSEKHSLPSVSASLRSHNRLALLNVCNNKIKMKA